MHTRAITDAFGTRLDPSLLTSGLAETGLENAVVVVSDGGFRIEHTTTDALVEMRALTWLRSLLSPLVPVDFVRREQASEGARFVDERQHPPPLVVAAEAWSPESLHETMDDLLARLGLERGEARGRLVTSSALAQDLRPLADALGRALNERLSSYDVDLGETTLGIATFPPGASSRLDSVTNDGAGPHFVAFERKGGATGVRPALVLLASEDAPALRALVPLLDDFPTASAPESLIDGLVWAAGRRPIVSVPQASDERRRSFEILVDPERCTACGLCARVCPTDYLGADGEPKTNDSSACIRCYDCVEACPSDALRPVHAQDTATLASSLDARPGWLSRWRGGQGPPSPSPFPPSFLLPKEDAKEPNAPVWVLGLAVTTMQEHAAALLKDGVVVGAIEEERLARRRHYGWHPKNRPNVTLCMDPRISIEEALCRRSVRALLEREGLTLDDIDVVALNGIPARWRRVYSLIDDTLPIPSVHAGRVRAYPHHLTHAASAYRASGLERAWVLTADGRGDRETASLFRADGPNIRRVFDVLTYTSRSIGGTYETVTRLLGFGSHGQGSTMALAALGKPTFDFSPFLSFRSKDDVRIDESGPSEAFAELRRDYDDPLNEQHAALAASLQAALEESITALLRTGGVESNVDALCLSGGVMLNCKLNGHLKRTFGFEHAFAQPGANDAGTAIGAALEAWSELSSRSPPPLSHALLGPSFTDDEIAPVLERSGYTFRRVEDIAVEVADRLCEGQVVCWFQGAMEFGPRALGARSILADPRSPATKDRVNRIKDRQAWRPFAPSILAGHESDWFEESFDSRFMLFAVPVREDKRSLVPAIVHTDGSTRPQSVHAKTHPLYHRLISTFYERTGVPLVVNTSFNGRGEPIVCTPTDALDCFGRLDADVLAIGSFLVEKTPRAPLHIESADALRALEGGRRLLLRLTVQADTHESFNTLRDMEGLPDRPFDDALKALRAGRKARCDELVILRGEAAKRADLPEIIRQARRMGYGFVQLQTSGRPLVHAARRQALLSAGIDAFEITLLGSCDAIHDRLARAPGAFRETASTLQALAQEGRDVLVLVPVVRGNARDLPRISALVARLGIRRLQFNFPRPVELLGEVATDELLRLTTASAYVRHAARVATTLGLTVTTEGFPFCHLDSQMHSIPDAREDFERHRVDDLHLLHESLTSVRGAARPQPPPCRSCSVRDACPKTWALYEEIFGTAELKPF